MRCKADVEEGVGERCSSRADAGEADGLDESGIGEAGTGVAIPRALASFAKRCGGNGVRGLGHEGATVSLEWSVESA